ncbi:hypothetical protein SXCC_04751 [Gluconacetobacter sp. SXCC-1]|nr:hypothetical protein SXCC_04751 [Gluconacetobacter sp. SXCC-1]
MTPEMEHRAAAVVFDRYGREILWTDFHAYMTAIGTPIQPCQPCADVKSVAWMTKASKHTPTVCRDVTVNVPYDRCNYDDLVFRTDMEVQLAARDEEIARLRVVEAEMHLLEEVCTFYANDEDRFIKADGNAEPYGMIPTDVGMKARSARARFMAREQAAQEAGGQA